MPVERSSGILKGPPPGCPALRKMLRPTDGPSYENRIRTDFACRTTATARRGPRPARQLPTRHPNPAFILRNLQHRISARTFISFSISISGFASHSATTTPRNHAITNDLRPKQSTQDSKIVRKCVGRTTSFSTFGRRFSPRTFPSSATCSLLLYDGFNATRHTASHQHDSSPTGGVESELRETRADLKNLSTHDPAIAEVVLRRPSLA